jgi:hypothetical protein
MLMWSVPYTSQPHGQPGTSNVYNSVQWILYCLVLCRELNSVLQELSLYSLSLLQHGTKLQDFFEEKYILKSLQFCSSSRCIHCHYSNMEQNCKICTNLIFKLVFVSRWNWQRGKQENQLGASSLRQPDHQPAAQVSKHPFVISHFLREFTDWLVASEIMR